MRRTSLLAISNFGFGQPDFDAEFGIVKQLTVGGDKSSVEAKAKVTKLPNGVRVVSQDLGGAQSTVGFYLKAGPKFDPSNRPGLSFAMRFALTTGNMESSHFQVDRTMRGLGMNYGHDEINKEWLVLKAEGRRDCWQKPLEEYANAVSAPKFAPYDLDKFRDLQDNLLEEKRWCRPRDYAIDQLETVAYWKNPLGAHRMVPVYANDLCNHKAMVEQWATVCVPKNVIVAGVNVDHDELIAVYQNSPYPHSADAPHHAGAQKLIPTLTEPNQYTPREYHEPEDRQAAKFGTHQGIDNCVVTALGFPLAAGANSIDNHANVLVLNELLSMALNESLGAASIDSQNVGHVRGHQSFVRVFDGASLFGITTQSNQGDATKDVIEANKVLKNGISITPENVKIAQVRAAARFYIDNCDVQRDVIDQLATGLVGDSTNHNGAAEFNAAFQRTSVDSVNKIYKPAVGENQPSLFATGSTFELPSLRQMGIH